jgi:tRNA-binding protein
MPEIIQYDEFLKLELRIGTVTAAEAHPNADKLLVLQVDLGGEQRQLVAGIRAHYDPAQIVGKQIVVVANLAPRMMRGLESKGMLLAASTPDKSQVVLLTTEKPVPPGSTVS